MNIHLDHGEDSLDVVHGINVTPCDAPVSSSGLQAALDGLSKCAGVFASQWS
jgi:hypothetical protein